MFYHFCLAEESETPEEDAFWIEFGRDSMKETTRGMNIMD
jgi:hypothetical protein